MRLEIVRLEIVRLEMGMRRVGKAPDTQYSICLSRSFPL